MKLTILSEAKAMDGFLSEHGLSFLLEVDHKSFLFDTGASDVFLRNAQALGINLDEVENVILSHGHWDHGNGLQHISGLPLLCHPGSFVKRFRRLDWENIGLALSRSKLKERFDLRTSREPVQLSEKLCFLGEVPRLNDFEAKTTKYVLGDATPDFIMDDSGLACVTEKGLVVISGCAHSGICNMVEHARQVTGEDRVEAVIGGFHLAAVNHQLRSTLEWMKEAGVKRVYPSHCTKDPALGQIHKAFGFNEVRAGASLEF
ncbi:MAG: MBL fold metallo-hydrolase [Bacteroides sp.]|nr:MBL fold metallo-hydrolase [Bacteroides sp.]